MTCCEETPCTISVFDVLAWGGESVDDTEQIDDDALESLTYRMVSCGEATLRFRESLYFLTAPGVSDWPGWVVARDDYSACKLLGENGCKLTRLTERYAGGALFRASEDCLDCGWPKEITDNAELTKRINTEVFWHSQQRQAMLAKVAGRLGFNDAIVL